MSRIKNIVFDVGRVILGFSHEKFFLNLQAQGTTYENSVDNIIEELKLLEFEHGFITDVDFLKMIQQRLSQPLAEDTIAKCWYDIFHPIPEMISLAKDLKKTKNVYLLSNTNNLHWQHIIKKYNFNNLAHGLMASCEVGAMKPDPKIYQAAEKKFSLVPEETVFIDDLEKNVIGARNMNWQGIVHKEYSLTKKELNRFFSEF